MTIQVVSAWTSRLRHRPPGRGACCLAAADGSGTPCEARSKLLKDRPNSCAGHRLHALDTCGGESLGEGPWCGVAKATMNRVKRAPSSGEALHAESFAFAGASRLSSLEGRTDRAEVIVRKSTVHQSRKFLSLFFATSFLGQMSCASLALQTRAHGILYADATMAASATQNSLGIRQGQACAHSVFGLVTWGDGGVAAAAKNGAIDNIASVDERSVSVLGIYAKACSIVSGSSLEEAADSATSQHVQGRPRVSERDQERDEVGTGAKVMRTRPR